uniref:(northern house mosquito) hypothetical protein n=1 Tax=Culex pipiens TaxID=7175 RepID=A0A8D8BBK8_CULPI
MVITTFSFFRFSGRTRSQEPRSRAHDRSLVGRSPVRLHRLLPAEGLWAEAGSHHRHGSRGVGLHGDQPDRAAGHDRRQVRGCGPQRRDAVRPKDRTGTVRADWTLGLLPERWVQPARLRSELLEAQGRIVRVEHVPVLQL